MLASELRGKVGVAPGTTTITVPSGPYPMQLVGLGNGGGGGGLVNVDALADAMTAALKAGDEGLAIKLFRATVMGPDDREALRAALAGRGVEQSVIDKVAPRKVPFLQRKQVQGVFVAGIAFLAVYLLWGRKIIREGREHGARMRALPDEAGYYAHEVPQRFITTARVR